MEKAGVRHPARGVDKFLFYFHKAYNRNEIKALFQLYKLYPEEGRLAFDDNYICSRRDPADNEY